MKRKLFAAILPLCLALSALAVAFAAELTQDTMPQPPSAQTNVSISVSLMYTVTIPSTVPVAYQARSTPFTIELSRARLEENAHVNVALTTDGALVNETDETATIPYVITLDGESFQSASYTEAGETRTLSVDITEEAWDAAASGKYAGTMTFTVSYDAGA